MLDQKLQQKQQQKLSPQQIQVIKMLEIPTMELDTRIKEEIEANPALEVDIDDDDNEEQEKIESEDDAPGESDNDSEMDDENSDEEKNDEFDIDDYFNEDEYTNYKESVNNTSPDQDDTKEIPFSAGNSFQENIKSQLGLLNLSEDDMVLADFLPLSLSGYGIRF